MYLWSKRFISKTPQAVQHLNRGRVIRLQSEAISQAPFTDGVAFQVEVRHGQVEKNFAISAVRFTKTLHENIPGGLVFLHPHGEETHAECTHGINLWLIKPFDPS